MIRYALACDKGHAFESWFSGSADFDAQKQRGLVTCPVCDSPKVEKQLMAPAVTASDKRAAALDEAPAAAPAVAAAPTAAPAAPPQPVALLSERDKAMREMLRALHRHVVAHSDDVGPRFADEARKMHSGEIDHRAIRGVASSDEARALVEEGIEFQPLPPLPDDRN